MLSRRSLATSLWLLAAAGAYAVLAGWADEARSGKLAPWTLVVLFWGVALVSVTIHHLSRYLSDQLAQAPDTLRRYSALSRQWRLGVNVQAKRFGRLRLRGRTPVARWALPAEMPPMLAATGNALPGQALSWTISARAMVAVSALGVRSLSEASNVMGRVWAEATMAASLHLSNALARVLDALRHCWLQLQPAVGRAQPLAARLGALIGVR